MIPRVIFQIGSRYHSIKNICSRKQFDNKSEKQVNPVNNGYYEHNAEKQCAESKK